MINYDPYGVPSPTYELINTAEKLGLQLVHIICDDKNVITDEYNGVSFLSMTPSIPQHGDTIELEDGKICEVEFIRFKVYKLDDQISLFPNVYCKYEE